MRKMWLSRLQLLTLACLALAADDETDKAAGSINDLFTYEESVFYSDEYVKLKDKVGLSPSSVESVFRHVERRLDAELEELAALGSAAVPTTTFEKIRNNGGRIPEAVAEAVRKRGVLVVRNVIPRRQVDDLVTDLHNYLYANNVLPRKDNQTVYEIYWSKSQMSARQHPNMIATQKALLGLWHASDPDVDADLDLPLMYADRMRIRPPGDTAFTLPPHIDGGGIERWKDDQYRQVYRHLLSGDVEGYEAFDPFEIDFRSKANMNDFGYANGCTFFRAFQGWLSLSNSGPGQGTLRVFPLLKEATAYWFLRPFQHDVPADLFPGCYPGKTFHVSAQWHPKIHPNLVSIPQVGPGDTVWWHADLVHSVESEHSGKEANSVLYIPTGPDCAINRHYLRRMRHAFMAGETPPDFPLNNYEMDFTGRATLADVTPEGRTTMGWPEIRIEDEATRTCSVKKNNP